MQMNWMTIGAIIIIVVAVAYLVIKRRKRT
jgi:LPXTG-motif cell wall-anchored protein